MLLDKVNLKNNTYKAAISRLEAQLSHKEEMGEVRDQAVNMAMRAWTLVWFGQPVSLGCVYDRRAPSHHARLRPALAAPCDAGAAPGGL